MKKFLSLLGVSVLSLSMLVGCGGATAEDIEKTYGIPVLVSIPSIESFDNER